MKRFVIITVGKTHSGKTTFARELEEQLKNSVVIDQDNHAEFINTHYRKLLPQEGPNTFKHTISQAVVDYAVEKTDCHLIICNSNRSRKGRVDLLEQFHTKGFVSIIVDFDLPDHVLQKRVSESERSTTIFKNPTTFEKVLTRQQGEAHAIAPGEGEADHLFVIGDPSEVQDVSRNIVDIVQNGKGSI
ncbi:ATP-binding protein [Pontibacillus marinus]|uniref:Type VI secretion protein n=1 Tax=Pontibacillus marinus BH030004 = DSM 16465 TaxID=1385511 RepID=A0A0A5G8T7_9BACI|nr:ATP-binding protein [Pontibacillus marinus]KGX89551.1 type VI secretion protein [Pontibacillus marinus BH030004 = DSM 16465]